MLHRFQFTDEQDRARIISENTDKTLIEEQNITEGNFLIFQSGVSVEVRVAQLEQQIQANTLIQYEVMATIFEELLDISDRIGGA